jgi:hypothetical protein
VAVGRALQLQVLLTQLWPFGHARPHMPQFWALVVVLTSQPSL